MKKYTSEENKPKKGTTFYYLVYLLCCILSPRFEILGFQDEEKCSPLLWVQKELDGHFVAYVVFTFNFNSLINDHI